MMRRVFGPLAALGLLFPCLSAQADPEVGRLPDVKDVPAYEESRFLRLNRDEAGEPASVDTSVIRYQPPQGKDGPTVDLVGVVHVGERAYYDELNERLSKYDVVLYELVAPKGTRVPRGGGSGRGGSALSQVQQLMQQFLALEYQLDRIDYTAENFVHADLSPEEWAQAREQRGETMLTTLFRLIGQAILQSAREGAAAAEASDALGDPLTLLMSPDRPLRLRRMMALQFDDADMGMLAFDSPGGSSLITDRNTAALAVLKEQIEKGHKKIAIFYGAGHNADFDKRLRDEFGLVPGEPDWMVAWDLTGKSLKESDPEPATIELPEDDGIQLLLPPLKKK